MNEISPIGFQTDAIMAYSNEIQYKPHCIGGTYPADSTCWDTHRKALKLRLSAQTLHLTSKQTTDAHPYSQTVSGGAR